MTARPAGLRPRLLNVNPTDQVLEIGYGPGVAISALVRAGAGHVYGVDHSAVMRRQAAKRNRDAIRADRVTLVEAPVDQLPATLDGPFDAILAVDSLGLWPDAAEQLAALRTRLASGGRIAIVSQLRTEILPLNPPVVCVLGS
ncbi:class I SAM-dependent methyltransferase [Catenulispora pinistramenti]|uniref:class I SAM-dependent methyltransferase n=1 Tax=Catenulispora pinistramenti TaxID=2705254 RepID=UPI0027DD78C0|nr:class I SAM-dependent methyltransferase [Catenulispora pinistramenti]